MDCGSLVSSDEQATDAVISFLPFGYQLRTSSASNSNSRISSSSSSSHRGSTRYRRAAAMSLGHDISLVAPALIYAPLSQAIIMVRPCSPPSFSFSRSAFPAL